MMFSLVLPERLIIVTLVKVGWVWLKKVWTQESFQVSLAKTKKITEMGELAGELI